MLSQTRSLNRLQKLEQYYNADDIVDIKINDDYSSEVNHRSKIYVPNKTAQLFHASNDTVKVVMGAFRSGKSVMSCHEILYKACTIPKCKDGIRRSRWIVVRNTIGKIETTTLNTWLQWFNHLPIVSKRKKPIIIHQYRFNDGEGIIELELLFVGLDREDQRDSLESLEVTGAYFNELQHIPYGIFSHMIGRVGQYPAKWQIEAPFWGGILGDTNPPDTDHWLYKYFEEEKIEGTTLFRQPPGLIKNEHNQWKDNPAADNVENLKEHYYYDYAKQNKFREEIIKVYCRGEWGIVVKGKHVFDEYNDDLHGVNDIVPLENTAIYLCWDFGLTPACLIVQFRDDGQLRCLKEFTTERMFIRELAKDIVKPFIEKNFTGFPVVSVGDPSGDAGKGVSEMAISSMEILREEGIETRIAITNNILPRLEAVKYYLNRLISGEPAFLLSKTGCPILRKAMSGYYFYKRMRIIGEDTYRDLPNKNHPYSDIADCLQYGAMECYQQSEKTPADIVNDQFEYQSVWL